MKVLIDKSFEKDTDKIQDKKLLLKVAECIEHVVAATDTNSIKQLKKLSGYKNHYRIRIGEYRAGILIDRDTVEFIRLIHRKDIYKYFP